MQDVTKRERTFRVPHLAELEERVWFPIDFTWDLLCGQSSLLQGIGCPLLHRDGGNRIPPRKVSNLLGS